MTSTAQFYEGDLDFGKRVPSLSGKLLIDAIMRADTLPMTRTIPFFSSSGERLLFSHADTNQLRNEVLVPGVRGLPWCTPRRPTNTGDREVAYDLMTFASLTEALYQHTRGGRTMSRIRPRFDAEYGLGAGFGVCFA